jgi:transposase
MLRQLRAARYGHLLAIHVLLLCAKGKTPTQIAEFLFCSRSSVYRAVNAYRSGSLKLPDEKQETGELQKIGIRCSGNNHRRLSAAKRALLRLLKAGPQAMGWCRTRWSCQSLSLELKASHGLTLSRETVRRLLHHLNYVWKRARHVAKDSDEERAYKLAQIRSVSEELGASERLVFADEMEINLLPKPRLRVDAEGHASGSHDPWPKSEAVSGGGSG